MSTVAYNGYTFPAWSQVQVQMNYIPTTGNIQTKYVQYVVSVSSIIYVPCTSDSASLDQTMSLLQAQLGVEGQILSITDAGFGANFRIAAGGKADVAHGPKPRSFQWEPIGTRAARITWVVELTLPRCPQQLTNIAEYEYSLTWNIAENGLTVRTITGQLEIANNHTRQGWQGSFGTKFIDTADAYRNRISFEPLDNFQRSQSFSLSPDKRVLSFTITDSEIPSDNPYYPGIVTPRVSYTVRSTAEYLSGNSVWAVNLSGSFEVAPGYHKRTAYLAMFEIIRTLRNALKNSKSYAGRGPAYTSPGDEEKPGSSVILRSLQITDEIFSRNVSISLEWHLLCSLKELISASGLWDPLPKESTWERWRASMANVQRPRGFANLFDRNEDVIIGLCSTQGFVSPGDDPEVNPPSDKQDPTITSDAPPPGRSWLNFQNDIFIEEDTNTATHRRLSEPKSYSQMPSDQAYLNSQVGNLASFSPGYSGASQDRKVSVLQTRGEPHYNVVLEGRAVRAVYGIPIPALLQIGGLAMQNQRPQSRRFKYKEFRTADNLPMYAAVWQIKYSIPGIPVGDLTQNIQLAGEAFNIG